MAEKDASARLRRAVKENNLFLVKRLIKRIDMRNPDPSTRRYTSLAWAAILGHEETFEFLLLSGHDDEELSKDADNNTILILLSELRPGTFSFSNHAGDHPDLMGAALRMARMYYDRYPFILEWSNTQGKTALHTAALKGNEDLARMLANLGADIDLPDNLGNTPLHYASAWGHIPVVQMLIERGCQYTARNHDGFTASDYAYTHTTMATLQETARLQYENKKIARRQQRQDLIDSQNISSRMRSASGGSRTTATSDSGETGLSPMQPRTGSSFSSSSSQPSFQTTGSKFPPPYSSPSLNHSRSFNASSPMPSNPSGSTSSLNPPSMNLSHVLSPVASRVRKSDADAIAEYKKRNRSGSAGTQTSDSKSTTNGITTLPTINGSSSHLPLASRTITSQPVSLADRRLRPSYSAAQLRTTPLPPVPVIVDSTDLQTPRNRSGTTPASLRPSQNSPIEANFSVSPQVNGQTLERRHSARRAGTVPMRQTDSSFTGPSSDYAQFPDPPTKTKASEPTHSQKSNGRRAFALLSKPLPAIDSQRIQREHRRTTSEQKSQVV